MLTLLLLSWLRDLFLGLPILLDAHSVVLLGSPMDKQAYRRTVTNLQSRIQRLEENLENSRVESAQKSALLEELRQLCLEKDDQLRRDIAQVNEIREEFEELKRCYAERFRRRICAVM